MPYEQSLDDRLRDRLVEVRTDLEELYNTYAQRKYLQALIEELQAIQAREHNGGLN